LIDLLEHRVDGAEGIACVLRHGIGGVGHVGSPVVLRDDVLKCLLGDRQSLLRDDEAVPGLCELSLQEGQIVDHIAESRASLAIASSSHRGSAGRRWRSSLAMPQATVDVPGLVLSASARLLTVA
jgi:hypothetical protein